jgi:hypothetical protein
LIGVTLNTARLIVTESGWNASDAGDIGNCFVVTSVEAAVDVLREGLLFAGPSVLDYWLAR